MAARARPLSQDELAVSQATQLTQMSQLSASQLSQSDNYALADPSGAFEEYDGTLPGGQVRLRRPGVG
jgi:hypothetical protein